MVVLEATALGFVFGVGIYGGHRGRVERGSFMGSVLYGQVAALGAAAVIVAALFAVTLVAALLGGNLGGYVEGLFVLATADGVFALVATVGIVALVGSVAGLLGNLVGRS